MVWGAAEGGAGRTMHDGAEAQPADGPRADASCRRSRDEPARWQRTVCLSIGVGSPQNTRYGTFPGKTHDNLKSLCGFSGGDVSVATVLQVAR